MITQSIYTLKLEIAHSGPGNLRGDKTVYITTHEYLIKYSDVVHYPEGISPAYACSNEEDARCASAHAASPAQESFKDS